MNVVVTGGAGFIGSHLTEQLLASGHFVTVVDDFSTGQRGNLPSHLSLSILEKNVLDCCAEDFPDRVNAIAHLAAIPSVSQSWDEPLAVHQNNLSTTVALIELCRRLHIPKIVFASSAAVYGDCGDQPINENAPKSPLSPYGLQKLTSERYGQLFASETGIHFIALRLFNVYGPRQRANSVYSGVISIFIDAMRNNRPLTLYGDGLQTRDFIYVRDVVAAFEAALLQSNNRESFVTCNIATGKSTSLVELIGILKQSFPAWPESIRFAAARTGDIRCSEADISEAFSELSFKPVINIGEGVRFLV